MQRNGIKLSKSELEKLKNSLPTHAIQGIAEEKGLSRRMVQYVIKGEWPDRHGIIKSAIKKAEAHKKQLELLKNKLNAL